MSHYRRNYEGRTYFFTVITDRRRPMLTTNLGRNTLREAIHTIKEELPFDIVAFVLLPDHLHTVWELPRDDVDYSTRWRKIKTLFTKSWMLAGGSLQSVSGSRSQHGEQGVWQRRFFEHTCRNAQDLKRCIDYIHANPLKHKLLERVRDWPWSSFHRFVEAGEYETDWGSANLWYGDEFKHFE